MEGFDEVFKVGLSLPKHAENHFFKGFGATSERDGGARIYIGYIDGNLPKDLINRKGSMGHGGDVGGACPDQ